MNRSSRTLPEAYLLFERPLGGGCPELWATGSMALAAHHRNRGLAPGTVRSLTLSREQLRSLDAYQRRCAPGQPFTVKLQDLAARQRIREAVERRRARR